LTLDPAQPLEVWSAVRYGTTKGEWFLNMVRSLLVFMIKAYKLMHFWTVVVPDGETIKTRQRARKFAAGFDFIGAEGTLGIATEGRFFSSTRKPFKLNTTVQLLSN
jgi:hypothetical protein